MHGTAPVRVRGRSSPRENDGGKANRFVFRYLEGLERSGVPAQALHFVEVDVVVSGSGRGS
jgi:hypothetical protein